jgi:hypothetical protein
LQQTGHPDPVDVYFGDYKPDFSVFQIRPARPQEVENIFFRMASFRPQAPLSLHLVRMVAPVQSWGTRSCSSPSRGPT